MTAMMSAPLLVTMASSLIRHVIYGSNQLLVWIVSISYQRHPSSTSYFIFLISNLISAAILITDLNNKQRNQNSLAHVVANTSKFEQIAPTPITTSNNYAGFLSNNGFTSNLSISHIQLFKFISNLHSIFTIVFRFHLIFCPQDHPNYRFCSSHMSEHSLDGRKRFYSSVFHDSGIPSNQTPVTRYLVQHSVRYSNHIFFEVNLLSLNSLISNGFANARIGFLFFFSI